MDAQSRAGAALMLRRRAVPHLLLLVAPCLAFAELTLRVQQWIGPVYDLETKVGTLDWYSDVVNHRPPLYSTYTLAGRDTYGEHEGLFITYEYDDLGIRKPYSMGSTDHCSTPLKILFLGDSFIEGYDVPNTVPEHVAKILAAKYNICVVTLNAGHSSYSPAIYVPLARQLVQALSPDYVVVDIDETDLADDALRYENLISRNEKGENVGVRVSPLNYEVSRRIISAESRALYIQRFVEKLYIRFALMPHYAATAVDPFVYSLDQDANLEQKYMRDLSIFRRNITELVGVLRDKLGSAKRIAFTRHPHLGHLTPGPTGARWNSLVATTVEKTVLALGALYYDSTPALRKRFGGQPGVYYWPGDMHLNFRGLEIYSEAVANFLAHEINQSSAHRTPDLSKHPSVAPH